MDPQAKDTRAPGDKTREVATEPANPNGTSPALLDEFLDSLPERLRTFKRELQVREFVGIPPKPQEEQFDLDFNGTKITLRTRDGQGYYFKEDTDEWESKDGELWIRRGTDGVGSWRGTIKFDAAGNLVEVGKNYGVTYVRRKDGSTSTSITNADGKVLTHTEFADGKAEWEGTSGKWTSADGNKWRNGTKVYDGTIGIDSFGRYWNQPAGSDKREFTDRSAENKKIVDKIDSMKKTYNISFSEAGAPYDYDYRDPETDTWKKVEVTYRFPSLPELDSLEKSLKQYAHLSKPGDKLDFDGMRFNFISAAGNGVKASGLYGWYSSNKDGISQVTFAPLNAVKEADAWEGMRGTALHEIGHHLQHKLWDKATGRETPQAVLDAFGFKYDKKTGNYRLEDKAGGLWELQEKRVRDKDGKWQYQSRWYPVVGDKVVTDDKRARTAKEMRDNLPDSKKPCTNYFTNPAEAHAEALSMYLYDRRMLWERNQVLYATTKTLDQKDIDGAYGKIKDTDGSNISKMMRGADGNIVTNNAENRRKVREMEDSWKNKQISLEQLFHWEKSIYERDKQRHNL